MAIVRGITRLGALLGPNRHEVDVECYKRVRYKTRRDDMPFLSVQHLGNIHCINNC